MNIKILNKSFTITKVTIVYFIVAFFYLYYLTKQVQYNTAFADEAIYATVGEGYLRSIYWESALSWMSGSYLYPIISAYLNRLWGLEGIRVFSTLCLLVTGILSGKIAKQLGGKLSEVITLTLFLFAGITLNLGQLGTYDTPAIVFTAVAVYLAIKLRYETGMRRVLLLLLSSLFMTLAFLSKYIAIFALPIIGILIAVKGKTVREIFKNFWHGIRNSIIWSSIFVTYSTYYVTENYEQIKNFITGSFFSEPDTVKNLIHTIVTSTNVVLFGAVIAFIYGLTKVKGEKKILISVLFLAGFLPIAYHLSKLNARSLPKHLVFSLFFWSPLAGWLLNKIHKSVTSVSKNMTYIQNFSQVVWTTLVIVMITNFWTSFSTHWIFQRSWPSTSKTLEYLREHRKSSDKILAEAASVYKFHLFDGFEDPSAWPSTWYLEYNGKQGVEAMKEAIEDKEFEYIILSDYFTIEINSEIKPYIEENYEVVSVEDYKLGGKVDQKTIVWKKKPTEQTASIDQTSEEILTPDKINGYLKYLLN